MSSPTSVSEELLARPRADTALRLTAAFFVVLLPKLALWHFSVVPIAVLCLLMLLSERLFKSRAAWWTVFALLAWGLAARWSISENSRFLDDYWCLACALALGLEDADEALAVNGRRLVGLAFALATIQKLARGEYVDGSFLHASALWDARFHSVALLGGRLTPAALTSNQELITALSLFPAGVESIRLATTASLRGASIVLSWWVLAVEGLIAVSFLLPRPRWLVERRDILLISFLLPTYLLAEVPQFGMILCIMGFASCPVERPRTRLAYLLVFAYLCVSDYVNPPLVATAVRLLG